MMLYFLIALQLWCKIYNVLVSVNQNEHTTSSISGLPFPFIFHLLIDIRLEKLSGHTNFFFLLTGEVLVLFKYSVDLLSY